MTDEAQTCGVLLRLSGGGSVTAFGSHTRLKSWVHFSLASLHELQLLNHGFLCSCPDTEQILLILRYLFLSTAFSIWKLLELFLARYSYLLEGGTVW